MIDKRLFQLIEKKPLIYLVIFRTMNLGLSIVLWFVFAGQLAHYLEGERISVPTLLLMTLIVLTGKTVLTKQIERKAYQASADLRIKLRQSVMEKAFRLGGGQEQLAAPTLAQLTVDGIEQLDIYYARFLPQLFYCLIASLMIFGVLAGFAWQPALVLLICTPLIPIVIMMVMKVAKRILSGYWSRYTDLGAKFHENLAGLSVLKAFNQDAHKHQEMVEDAEGFRKVTMSLLSMQLNSITIMDIVSYSGAALGIGLALIGYARGTIETTGAVMFLLLSAEFFIPMRQLGSLFHVAMNGISACSKLFTYLELPEQVYGTQKITAGSLAVIHVKKLSFLYDDKQQPALDQVSAVFSKGSFSALVGKSGSGKSTFARVLLHQLTGYEGSILWDQTELGNLSMESIRQQAVLVDNHGYLYPQSVRENLLIANPKASDAELWHVLEKVHLKDFVQKLPQQLNEPLLENGGNLSGGQKQRLVLARALLRNTQLYIFDEITSGVDLASEEIILAVLKQLAKEKIVLFISHRLYNVLQADQVLVFEEGRIVEQGPPEKLHTHSTYFKNYFREERQFMNGGVER